MIQILGKHFFNLGLNITCIGSSRNENNYLDRNLLKAPMHQWMHLQSLRQTQDEISSYDWSNAVGLGVVLGYDNLMAIDIDGCIEEGFLQWICKELDIPETYDWIVRSGSGTGYHLILYCNDRPSLEEEHHKFMFSTFGGIDKNGIGINAYYPRKKREYHTQLVAYKQEMYSEFFSTKFFLEDLFQKIEFRWTNHLVLPTSLHESGLKYQFINDTPQEIPISVSFKQLSVLRKKICSNAADFSGWEGTADHDIAYEDEISINQAKKKYYGNYKPNYIVVDVLINSKTQVLEEQSTDDEVELPEILQIAWIVVDHGSNIISHNNSVIRPDGYKIKEECNKVYNISSNVAHSIGRDLGQVVNLLIADLSNVDIVICYDYDFVSKVIESTLDFFGIDNKVFKAKKFVCIRNNYSTNYSGIRQFMTRSEIYERKFGRSKITMNSAYYSCLISKICLQSNPFYGIQNSKLTREVD